MNIQDRLAEISLSLGNNILDTGRHPMNYTVINRQLRKEFGKGQVELRKAKDKGYDCKLWFASDSPSKKVIERAKEIVGEVEPSFWFDARKHHSV